MIHSSVGKITILLKLCSLHVSEQNTSRHRKKQEFYTRLGLVAIKRGSNKMKINPSVFRVTFRLVRSDNSSSAVS